MSYKVRVGTYKILICEKFTYEGYGFIRLEQVRIQNPIDSQEFGKLHDEVIISAGTPMAIIKVQEEINWWDDIWLG